MNELTRLLPRNKFDFKRVHRIRTMSREEIIPLLPGLMEWVQDMNWPIATEVTDLLLLFPKEIVSYIHHVFETSDGGWKYWCLECLVEKLPHEDKCALKNDLIRIAEKPTADEIIEELDKKALEILNFMREVT